MYLRTHNTELVHIQQIAKVIILYYYTNHIINIITYPIQQERRWAILLQCTVSLLMFPLMKTKVAILSMQSN